MIICYKSSTPLISSIAGVIMILNFCRKHINIDAITPIKTLLFESKSNATNNKLSVVDGKKSNNIKPLTVNNSKQQSTDNSSKETLEVHPIDEMSSTMATIDSNSVNTSLSETASVITTSSENLDKYKTYGGNINNIIISDGICPNNLRILDGDERMAYLNKVRNEPTRVIAGMSNMYSNIKKYIEEEVVSEESKEWWGNSEY
jgi:hypothetical protein